MLRLHLLAVGYVGNGYMEVLEVVLLIGAVSLWCSLLLFNGGCRNSSVSVMGANAL